MADQVATYGALPAVRYGRPTYDFAAAPSLFVSEVGVVSAVAEN
jgi:hypothetical protein